MYGIPRSTLRNKLYKLDGAGSSTSMRDQSLLVSNINYTFNENYSTIKEKHFQHNFLNFLTPALTQSSTDINKPNEGQKLQNMNSFESSLQHQPQGKFKFRILHL